MQFEMDFEIILIHYLMIDSYKFRHVSNKYVTLSKDCPLNL